MDLICRVLEPAISVAGIYVPGKYEFRLVLSEYQIPTVRMTRLYHHVPARQHSWVFACCWVQPKAELSLGHFLRALCLDTVLKSTTTCTVQHVRTPGCVRGFSCTARSISSIRTRCGVMAYSYCSGWPAKDHSTYR